MIGTGRGRTDQLEGGIFSQRTCQAAALDGRPRVPGQPRARDRPWDGATCQRAAGHGRPEVSRWAREDGCLLDRQTWERAASDGHLNLPCYNLLVTLQELILLFTKF